MKTRICLLTAGILLAGIGSAPAGIQTFENGLLENWALGGARLGTNTWTVTDHLGSKMAYLRHMGYKDLTATRLFDYEAGMELSFDAEFRINGSGAPTGGSAENYTQALVNLQVLDALGNLLVQRYAGISSYPAFNPGSPAGLSRYAYDIDQMLTGGGIDPSRASAVRLRLVEYTSSSWNNDDVLEIWIDNVAIPEPAALCLLGLGALLAGRKRNA